MAPRPANGAGGAASAIAHVHLAGQAAVSAHCLSLRYRIENASALHLAVLNRLWEAALDGSRRYDPSLCYVDIEERTLHLAQMRLPQPGECYLARAADPHATYVPPGASMDHEITLPIPVEACNPYAKGCLDQVASAEHLPIAHGAVDHLVLSIGVVPLRGAIELRRGAPYQEIRLLPSELPFGKQSILQCSLRLIERVAVLDYGLPTGAQPSETGSESL